ncbi:MAG: hypothetical protein O7E52_25625 [Candidatus Poribacteria bacterium]|nr:hypothetical protein [Candidatus Poribacteria bacterium]
MKRLLLKYGIYFTCLFLVAQLADAQERITGPWLWMVAPTPFTEGVAVATELDSLARATDDEVTEEMVAKDGAKPGDRVGKKVWTLGEISPSGGNNVNEVVIKTGLGSGDMNRHSAYALITIESPHQQNGVMMRVGSDDAIKVWLNGDVVHTMPVIRPAGGFLEAFKVNLNQGNNLLMIKVVEKSGDWSMFAGIQATFTAAGKEYERPPKPGDKITGPWLWMIVPSENCGPDGHDTDWLSEASEGRVTEKKVAKNGVKARAKVGKLPWTEGKIEPEGGNNTGEAINNIRLGNGAIENHFAYAYINVVSPSARRTRMFAGSDDSIQVWLNGEVIWENAVIRFAEDFQEDFSVELKKGDNPLLVKIGQCGGNWSMFVGFSKDDRDLKFNTDIPQAVEPIEKLVTTWGYMKNVR